MDNTKSLIMNAGIAALYAVLTIALAPISYGPVQVRLSEAMTLLAFVNPKLLPGLVIGCFAANLTSPLGPIDMVVGTVATFLALWPMRYVKSMTIASLFPADIPPEAFPATALYIGAGEFLSVCIIGRILLKLLLSRENIAQWLHF